MFFGFRKNFLWCVLRVRVLFSFDFLVEDEIIKFCREDRIEFYKEGFFGYRYVEFSKVFLFFIGDGFGS